MKRIVSSLISVLAFSFAVSAQNLEPGIYSVMDGNATHLVYTNGTAISSSSNIIGLEIGDTKYKYKGETAVVFRPSKLGEYDFTGIYGFIVI